MVAIFALGSGTNRDHVSGAGSHFGTVHEQPHSDRAGCAGQFVRSMAREQSAR